MQPEHKSFVDGMWENNIEALQALLDEWGLPSEDVLLESEKNYQTMLQDCAYTDDPTSALGRSFFVCLVYLALYQVVRNQIDAHQVGSGMLTQMRKNTPEFDARANGPVRLDIQSPGTHPGEFDVEAVEVSDNPLSWGFNIKSCAICYQFSKYDAMDLVPYMCAADDIISDKGGQGLRRTGTIALGASHCDFRYDPDGEPRRVAEDYPDKIKFVH